MKSCPNCGTELDDGQVCGCGGGSNASIVSSSFGGAQNGGFIASADGYSAPAGGYSAPAGVFSAPIGGEKMSGVLESMKNRMGLGTPEQNATDTYEREMKIAPECISAEENEIPVRQYNVTTLRILHKLERAEGRMQVTNKRVIFRATGRSIRGRTTQQYEFAVNEIAGIEARQNYRFDLLFLVFAIFISLLSYSVISLIFSQNASLPSSEVPFSGVAEGMMYPSHVQKAYEDVRSAESQTAQAAYGVQEANENVRKAKETEENAVIEIRDGVWKTRRVQTGTSYWGQPYYENQRYRDTTQATLAISKLKLDQAVNDRKKAENAEVESVKKLDEAKLYEAEMIKRRDNTVNMWKFLMTILGVVLGIGGLIPFFMLYKRFGLKLFILGFSVFGFSLSLVASGISFFYVFVLIAVIVEFICLIIYCFRPNLIISIKTKGATPAVDIRRETILTMFIGGGKGVGFFEVLPTEETESAIREIGAMIGDIQKMGDLGLDKWRVR